MHHIMRLWIIEPDQDERFLWAKLRSSIRLMKFMFDNISQQRDWICKALESPARIMTWQIFLRIVEYG